MAHKITPAKYVHRVLAFPEVEGNPFPISVLAYEGSRHGLHLTPDSEADSGRLQLNPLFGDCGPFWLRAAGCLEVVQPFTVEGWRFVPWRGSYDLGIAIEQVRSSAFSNNRGEKGCSLKYAHYARITTKHTFPIDMLRYDRCAPRTVEDAITILDIEKERRGGVVNIVQLSNTASPRWWPDRWHSFSNLTFERQ